MLLINEKNTQLWKLMPYQTGSDNGLELVMDVSAEEYVDFTPSVRIRHVHNPDDDPDPMENEINISPGFETHIAITKFTIQRLPFAYRDY